MKKCVLLSKSHPPSPNPPSPVDEIKASIGPENTVLLV